MYQTGEQNNEKSQKSRHLSILDYYETLQLEWIIADLRRRIYPRLKDKNYWTRVQEGKKETVVRLAEKNSLPSIFSDDTMLREFEKKVYRDQGHPIFVYKDEKNRNEQEFLDLRSYYGINSDVRVMVLGETKIGKITKEYTPYKDINVIVTIDGEEKPYSISLVTRIL